MSTWARRALLMIGALAAAAVAAGLIGWAIAAGTEACQPGYEYRYQYTTIIGKTPIAHYGCERAR